MTGGNARHGRRDNGLHAATYAVVGDVDPRVGEHLLDVLGNRGIAAYLQPTVDQNPITRVTTLPGRPTDRLFVDRTELDTAREFLAILARDGDGAMLTPEPADGMSQNTGTETESDTSGGSPSNSAATGAAASATPGSSSTTPAARASNEFEQAWASIVAGFDSAAITGPTPWPAIEDLSTHNGSATSPTTPPSGSTPPQSPSSSSAPPTNPSSITPTDPITGSTREWPRWTPPAEPDDRSLLDGLDSFGTDLPDDDEDDYQPPPPPPLPHLATITIFGIIGILGGVAIIVYPALLPGLTSTSAAVLGCVLIIAGAVALIGRLRSGTDDDEPDDPDHGAVV